MKKSIYILEDNASTRIILEMLLLEENYRVESYQFAEDFLNKISRKLPDMVILDIHLPDGNGMKIAESLKGNNKTHHIPIMVMSGNNYIYSLKNKFWADEFINKPFDINDFVNRIDRYLN